MTDNPPARTRFAPSPTGDIHLGNARVAVLCWLYARRHDGQFIVRFEDTDVDRNVERAEQGILDSLDWLGLDPDEGPACGGPHGPYRQSERQALYRKRAEDLMARGLAFPCFCTEEERTAYREQAIAAGMSPGADPRCRALSPDERERFVLDGRVAALRLAVDPDPVVYHDLIRGELSFPGADLGDFVLLRNDGRPTYNFAVVVDDIDMRISHVIRGVGHLSNTPKQVLLYDAFGEPAPVFVHVPTVLAPGGGKLSKRSGARGLLQFREQGYHPDAVLNYLSLLSWSSETGEEVLSRDELIDQIDLSRLGATDVELDLDKMRWLSGRHISADSAAVLARRIAPFLPPDLELTDAELMRGAEVVGHRILLLTDGASELTTMFREPGIDPEAQEALTGEDAMTALRAARTAWAGAAWERGALKQALEDARSASGLGGAAFFKPLRAALTGQGHGPDLADTAYAMGQSRVLERLDGALEDGALQVRTDPNGKDSG